MSEITPDTASPLCSPEATIDGHNPDAVAEAIASVERSMFVMRKRLAKRELLSAVLKTFPVPLDPAELDTLAVIAQHDASAGSERGEVTVGLIAERLGLDPSRASRLVAEVVERGLARRVASQADARRICLELSESGIAFSEEFRKRKHAYFVDAFSHWSEADVVAFAHLFEKFSNWGTEALERIKARQDAEQVSRK